jgi:hypothetical protein
MTTQAVTASVTSPALGATLASITIPASQAGGTFQAVASVWYAGTLTLATDSDNVAIQSDPVTASTFVTAEVLSAPAVVSGAPVLFRCILAAQTTIKLIAVAAGTASSVYHVHLEANPVDPVTIGLTT